MNYKILLLFILSGAHAYATTRPNIDTVSIIGITPGLDGKLIGAHTSELIDTLLWNEDGTGIVKFPGYYLNTKGDFRIAYEKGQVSQISFVAPTHDSTEKKKIYSLLSQVLAGVYGVADIETVNAVQEMRWEGMKQSVSIKAEDGSNYVTISISKFIRDFGH